MSVTFFADRERVLIDPAAVARLRAEALASARRRARLCLHPGPDDPVQEMLIAVAAGSWIPPHRQVGKEKSYLVLQGELAVVRFADEQPAHAVRLGASGAFLYRFDATTWHTVVVPDGIAVYLETVAGPWRAEGTEFAPWASDAAGLAVLEAWLREGG